MPRASLAQTSFNAGIFSPNVEGRVDLQKYDAASRQLRNFTPTIQGPALKRSGSRFVREVKDSSKNTRILPFEFSTTQAYILEFGDLYMRVYKDGGIVLDGVGPAVFELVTPYAHADLRAIQITQSADVLYLAHPSYAPRKITRGSDHDEWTIEVIDFDWQPFQPENVNELDGAASSGFEKDAVVTLTSSGGNFTSDMVGGYFKFREIIESNNGEWEPASDNLAYNGQFAPGDTRYYEGNVYQLITGISSVTGTSPPIHEFGSDTDGKRAWAYLHSGEGYVKVTGYTDSHRVTGVVIKHLPRSVAYADVAVTGVTNANPCVVTAPSHGLSNLDRVYLQDLGGITELNQQEYTVTIIDANSFSLQNVNSGAFGTYTSGGIVVRVTHRWAHGAWSNWAGWPMSVDFFEDRLFWAGAKRSPQTCWGSRTGQYENHKKSNTDEGALLFTLNTSRVNVIQSISAGKELVILTSGAEFTMSSGSQEEPLTAGNVKVLRRSTRGSKASVMPIRVGEVVLFVIRSGRKLLEFGIVDFDTDTALTPDLAVLSAEVPLAGIREMAYQQEPHRIVWQALENGELVAFTYEREQQVAGWHRHPLGGTDVVVESVAVIPHPDGDEDQLWLVVRRTVDGGTVRYIEYLESDWLRGTPVEDAFFVDSGLTYDGAPATVLSGLDHLEGETVEILADGTSHPQKTVSGGSITLDREASVVQVGLPYAAEYESLRFEAGAADGVAQGKTKRIHKIVFRLDQSGGAFEFGPSLSGGLERVQMRRTSDPLGQAIPLFDGDTERLSFPGGYSQEGRVAFRHSLPMPCTLVALFPQLATQDGG